MFWIAVIVIVIVLGAIFIRFPAQTLGVIASLIGLWYVLHLDQEKETRRREERDNNVVVRIGYNASVCARETPLAVTITNTSDHNASRLEPYTDETRCQ
jgi:hypothetical protein